MFEEVGIDFVVEAGVALRDGSNWPGGEWGLGRGAGGRVVPEAAMLENFADDLALASLDEGDDFHLSAALGAAERVGVVNVFDEHGPAAVGTVYYRGLLSRIGGRGYCIGGRGRGKSCRGAGLVGVAAVVADQVFAFVGNVLGQFGQEVQRGKELEIPFTDRKFDFALACWMVRGWGVPVSAFF